MAAAAAVVPVSKRTKEFSGEVMVKSKAARLATEPIRSKDVFRARVAEILP